MFKSEVNMLSGPVLPGLLRMTIPIMVMQILQALFNILDMTILKMAEPPVMNELGELVDSVAVGAVGACTQLISVFTVIVIGLATGANIVIARHLGSGDSRRVERAVGASTLLAIITAAIMVLIGVPFAEIFLKSFSTAVHILISYGTGDTTHRQANSHTSHKFHQTF